MNTSPSTLHTPRFIPYTSYNRLSHQSFLRNAQTHSQVTIQPKKPRFPRENEGLPARVREKTSNPCNVAGVTIPRSAKTPRKRAFFPTPSNRARKKNEKCQTERLARKNQSHKIPMNHHYPKEFAMFLRYLLIIASCLLIGGSSRASYAVDNAPETKSLAPAKAEAVDAAVRAEMKKQKLVGVAVGVIEDGRIVYLKGYGTADIEKRTPVTAETVFNWASNSKPLAAVLAMQLVEQGKLDLDADVRKYVPEFPDKNVKITCRHLLTHQSGIPHYSNGTLVPTIRKYDVPKPFADPVLALDKFNGSPLLFQPGERNAYSSYAYILLSAVIQRAANTPFTELVEAKVVKPLGLKSFQLDTDDIKPDWATGYQKKGQRIVRAPDEANDWKHGAGAFKSNVRDFARWAEALINRELVSEATEKIMWEPQKLNDGKPSEYGLGFRVETGRRLMVSHNGQQTETTTRMMIYPREKRGLVVMCNCNFTQLGKLTSAICAALGL